MLPCHGPPVTQDAFIDHHDFLLTLKELVLGHMRDGRTLREIKELAGAAMMEDFGDYQQMDSNLEANIVTMWDYLYRYREPNLLILPDEAVACTEDSRQCRTSDP